MAISETSNKQSNKLQTDRADKRPQLISEHRLTNQLLVEFCQCQQSTDQSVNSYINKSVSSHSADQINNSVNSHISITDFNAFTSLAGQQEGLS